LDDNAFDRMHSQHYSQQCRAAQQQQQEQHEQLLPEPADQEQAPAAAAAAMDVDDADLPELEAPAAAATSQPAAAVTGGEQQQQQQPAKRHKPGSGQVWVPPHRRPDFRCDNLATLSGIASAEEIVCFYVLSAP
jgi:hypothetical protein